MAEPSAPSEPSGSNNNPAAKPETAAGMFDDPAPTPDDTSRFAGFFAWLPSLRTIGLIPLALIGFLLIYYIGGMMWMHRIDDSIEFSQPSKVPDGASVSVALAADLIERETVTHRWLSNDPFFMPTYLLDNTPNFQQGIMTALFRFTSELRDEIARTRGSSSEDPDAKAAAGYLSYPPDVWIFNPEVSWWAPTAPSEKQYEQGMRSLRQFNQRLVDGEAKFETRADNLQTLIDRFTSDIGSASAAIDRHIEDSAGGILDFRADNLFYANKGRLYAYYLLIRGMQEDFADVINEKNLRNAWRLTLTSLEAAATLQPWVVMNGAPDSQIRPSHLAAQGFYLLRARTQLKEISNILLK